MDDISTVSDTGFRILANPETFFNDEELETMRNEQDRKRRILEQAQHRKADREVRQHAKTQRVQSFVQSVASEVSSSAAPAPQDWLERLRATGAHLPAPSAAPSAAPSSPQRTPRDDVPPPSVVDDAIAVAQKRLADPKDRERLKRYVKEELNYRMKKSNASNESSDEASDEDLKEKEKAYWRRHLELEDKEISNGFTIVVTAITQVIETILSDVLEFHSFETKNLSKEIDNALKEGRFDSAIRRFRESGSASFMKDPLKNALATFVSVALKNHMDHQKSDLVKITKDTDKKLKERRKKNKAQVDARVSKKKKKAKKNRKRTPEPSSDKEESEESAASSTEYESEEEDEEEEVQVPIPSLTRRKSKRKAEKTQKQSPREDQQRVTPRETPREETRETQRMTPRETQRVTPREAQRVTPREVQRVTPRETPRTPPAPTPRGDDDEDDVAFMQSLEPSTPPPSSARVIDPVTGKPRLSLVDAVGASEALDSMMGSIQNMAPTIGTLSKKVKETCEIQAERDALGKPPAIRSV